MLRAWQSLPERYGRPAVSGSYLLPLDGLRALAIAIVIFWHIGIRVFRLTLAGPMVASDNAGFLHRLPHGEIGVSLFFFISGFIIARPFVAGQAVLRGRALRQFYVRRIIRIAPPHLLLIIAAFIALALVGYRPERAVNFNEAHQSLWASLLASVVYLNGLVFHTPPRLNPPTWSLEIEMQFYLLFPALLAIYVRVWAKAGVLVAAIVPPLLGLGIASLAHAVWGAYGPLRWTVLVYLYLFTLGISVARLEMGPRRSPRFPPVFYDALFLLGLGLLLATGLFRYRQQDVAELIRIVATAGAVLMLFYGAMGGGVATRILSGRWVTLAGAMSYSIYLTHVAVIQLTASLLFKIVDLHNAVANLFLGSLVIVPPVLVVGCLYYIGIERYFMKFGHHARQPPASVF